MVKRVAIVKIHGMVYCLRKIGCESMAGILVWLFSREKEFLKALYYLHKASMHVERYIGNSLLCRTVHLAEN